MKNDQYKARKAAPESKSRDKTRDRTGVKATRRDARKSKDSRRSFESGDWQ